MLRQAAFGLLCALLLAACQPVTFEGAAGDTSPVASLWVEPVEAPTDAPTEEAVGESTATPSREGVLLEPEGFIQRVHDPVMAREGDTYYLFSSGGRAPFLCSPDMVTWEFCGRVFPRDPSWAREVNPAVFDIWAPDISYFNNRWHLYYSVSSMGSQESAIGLATNVTLDPDRPEYAWVDHGQVLRSQTGDPWNAIDPNVVLDEQGEPWLAWGSYWHGLWLAKVDPASGQLAVDEAEFIQLADRSAGPDGNPAIEGVFIVPHADEWFLFASFDQCCQGVNSTYNVRVGRSDKLTGPYVDRDGVPLTEGGGTRILAAYGQWQGPGHNGIFIEEGANGAGDTYWIVYHAYDSRQIGISKLRIESIGWDEEGWPTLPSQAE